MAPKKKGGKGKAEAGGSKDEGDKKPQQDKTASRLMLVLQAIDGCVTLLSSHAPVGSLATAIGNGVGAGQVADGVTVEEEEDMGFDLFD